MSGNFKTGDTAYVYDPGFGVAEVKLQESYEQDGQKGFWVNFQYSVDKNGKPVNEYYLGGTSVRLLDDEHTEFRIYKTAGEAHKALASLRRKQYSALCDSVKTIEDFAHFPLEHILIGEDADEIARQVYIEKSKEILGIDVEKPIDANKSKTKTDCEERI